MPETDPTPDPTHDVLARQPAPAPEPVSDPTPEPEPDPAPDPADKNKSREGYALRQAQTELTKIQRELTAYKQREEDARKAKLTEDQRLREELDAKNREVETLRTQALQSKIAAEFKLPSTLAIRLIGSDEDALRADAEELAKLLPRPKVGTGVDPAKGKGEVRYSRAQLQANPTLARSPEVIQASREGRIDP